MPIFGPGLYSAIACEFWGFLGETTEAPWKVLAHFSDLKQTPVGEAGSHSGSSASLFHC